MQYVIATLRMEIERCNVELAAHTDDDYFTAYKAELEQAIAILEVQ